MTGAAPPLLIRIETALGHGQTEEYRPKPP